MNWNLKSNVYDPAPPPLPPPPRLRKCGLVPRAVRMGFFSGQIVMDTEFCLTISVFPISYHATNAPHLPPFVSHRRVLVRTLINSPSKLRRGPTH
jgi:hypothetical protein